MSVCSCLVKWVVGWSALHPHRLAFAVLLDFRVETGPVIALRQVLPMPRGRARPSHFIKYLKRAQSAAPNSSTAPLNASVPFVLIDEMYRYPSFFACYVLLSFPFPPLTTRASSAGGA